MDTIPPLPPNVHVSKHPCLQAKLSQLRANTTHARDTKTLVHEIALIVGCEALAKGLQVRDGEVATTPLDYPYTTTHVSPSQISLIPVLRSGLGMVDAIQTLLPFPVPVHHLGLFREPTSLQPVEYYNNLPYHQPPPPPSQISGAESGTQDGEATAAADLAILIDPVIATGGTSVAAIQTLREWGVGRVILLAVLGSAAGVQRAAEEWVEGVEVWVGAVDAECDDRGMIKPGLGDVGDRLFLTMGK